MNWDKRKLSDVKKYKNKQNRRPYPYNIPWQGAKPISFEVYKIPTKLLSYNFRNTRIRAELEGILYKKHQSPDPRNPTHNELVQKILLESKWIGTFETSKLTEDLQKRGQLDPVIATPDGVLIDGNRRLAIFRFLQDNEPESKGFTELETCILPENATEDDLKELEMRIQMYHQFQVNYGDINTALEFRYLHKELGWSLQRISEITGNQYTESKIEKMIDVIDLIDEYLDSIPPPRSHRKQYATLDKGWESFDNIYRMLNWTEQVSQNDKRLQELRKYFGFEIIASEDTTYAHVRHFYSVLRSEEASKRLEGLSDTLQGKNLQNFMSPRRIEKEIDNLRDAYEHLESLKVEPKMVAEQAFKKLDSIKINKVSKNDRELERILNRILEKIKSIKSKI